MRTLTAPRRRNGGFSLIELMVAMVIGLIVSGAVLAFTVSSVRANSEYVQAVRLTQELRAIGQFVDSELRRAGYDEAALSYVANTSATEFSDFSPILVDDTADANCVIYAYDRAPGNPGQIDLANQEVRGIRRSTVTIDGEEVGVVEMAESGTAAPACDGTGPDYTKFPVGCNTTSGWCAFSDPRTVAIDTFDIDVDGDADSSHGAQDITATGYTPMQIREFKVSLAGHLRSDADVTQSLSLNVKVRANCLRELVTKCNAVPGA
jgi:prepilin peptidase dependent protein B